MAAIEQQNPQGPGAGQGKEKEVAGNVVFAKTRPKPAPKPNPLQAILQNKLIMMVAAGVVGLALIFGVIKVISSSLKASKKHKEAMLKEAQEEKKQVELLADSTKPTKPADVLKREEEMVGEPLKPADQARKPSDEITTEELEKEAAAVTAAVEEPAPYIRPARKRAPKRPTDTDSLAKILKEAVAGGNEGDISYAVMGIEKNGDSAIALLKDEIVNNYNNPKIRINAILGLFYSAKHEAIAVVKTALMVDPDEDVRLTALSVLDSLGGRSEADFIESLARDDSSEKVRQRAQELLEFRSIDQ